MYLVLSESAMEHCLLPNVETVVRVCSWRGATERHGSDSYPLAPSEGGVHAPGLSSDGSNGVLLALHN